MPAHPNVPSVHAVADFFLLKVAPDAGDSITNLKLQKLCYFAQAWSLALRGRPCFGESIQAWAHGPAVPKLYQRFRSFRWQALDPYALRTNPEDALAKEDHAFLDDVWDKYGGFSGKQLESITHEEAPWMNAYEGTPPGGRCTAEISHEAIESFYKGKLETPCVR